MTGVVDTNNYKRQTAVGQLGYLANLDTARENTNNQIRAGNKQRQNRRIGSALGGAATMAMATTPMGWVAGGVMILGSLF